MILVWKSILEHVFTSAFRHTDKNYILCISIYHTGKYVTGKCFSLILHLLAWIKKPTDLCYVLQVISLLQKGIILKERLVIKSAQVTKILCTHGHVHKQIHPINYAAFADFSPTCLRLTWCHYLTMTPAREAWWSHWQFLMEFMRNTCQCLILSQQYVPALTYAIFLISLPLSLGQSMLINTADNTPRSAFLPALLLLK